MKAKNYLKEKMWKNREILSVMNGFDGRNFSLTSHDRNQNFNILATTFQEEVEKNEPLIKRDYKSKYASFIDSLF